eukprot:gene28571-31731_t
MRHFLASRDAQSLDADNDFLIAGRPGSVGAAGAGRHHQMKLDDELEVQFQIGNSFTTRGLVGRRHKRSSQQLGTKGTRPSGSSPQLAMGTIPKKDSSLSSNYDQHSGPVEALSSHNRILSILDTAPGQVPRASSPRDEDMYSPLPVPPRVEEIEEGYNHSVECFHEIHAIPMLDPVLDKQNVFMRSTRPIPCLDPCPDSRVELENQLADLTEAQLSMLEHLFPRHVIEYMLAKVPKAGNSRNMQDLANTHEKVGKVVPGLIGNLIPKFTLFGKVVSGLIGNHKPKVHLIW